MRTEKQIAIWILRWLLAVLLALVAADWVLGILLQWRISGKQSKQPVMTLFPAPYIMSATRPDSVSKDSGIQINAQGFRYPVDVTPHHDRPRLLINGASFAFGAGASSDATYYVRYLQQRFPDIEIITASGAGGFVSPQEWIHLSLNLLPLQPDGILMIDGFGDITLPVCFGLNPGEPWQWDVNSGYMTGRSVPMLKSFVMQHSSIYRVARRLQLNRRASSEGYYRSEFPKIVDSYLRGTRLSYETCRSHGIPVWHVFHPQLAVGKTPSAEEKGFSLGGIDEGMRRMYPELARQAVAQAAQYNVPFFNMIRVLEGHNETLYVDYVHLNDAGQKILGESIADFLSQNQCPQRLQEYHRRVCEKPAAPIPRPHD